MATVDSTPLERGLAAAFAGDVPVLFDTLSRMSGLPGKNANLAACKAFAHLCAGHGRKADAVIVTLAGLDESRAPGATSWEFLPMCGVYAAGVRASQDEAAYGKMLQLLHERADDSRFRVRDTVVLALVEIGTRAADRLITDFAGWTDGYFHASAVLRCLAHEDVWPKLTARVPEVCARIDEAFELVRRANRSESRYPGHKDLLVHLGTCPARLAAAFGTPVFDLLVAWSATPDPALRAVVEKNLSGARLAGRHADELRRVQSALAASAKAVRDPRTIVGPTRRRGSKSKS